MDHETEDVLAGEWLSGYRGRMLAVARRFAGRATTAEDIVQQALQAAYNARGQLKKTSATGAWLVRITYSVGLRIRSKRARRQELLREHWLREGDSLEVAGSKADPRVAEVLEAMQGLPASQQEIVRCVLVDGLSDGEIAEKLGRPRGTVRVYKHRAVGTLKGKLHVSPSRRGWSNPRRRGNVRNLPSMVSYRTQVSGEPACTPSQLSWRFV